METGATEKGKDEMTNCQFHYSDAAPFEEQVHAQRESYGDVTQERDCLVHGVRPMGTNRKERENRYNTQLLGKQLHPPSKRYGSISKDRVSLIYGVQPVGTNREKERTGIPFSYWGCNFTLQEKALAISQKSERDFNIFA
jgi:hypothetical protein